jgi:hypothetical protein
MSQNAVNLTPSGPPSTFLPDIDPAIRHELRQSLEVPVAERRAVVAAIVSRHPRCIDAWVALGELGRDDIERYACFRVAYHRGLDMLRQNGWRGSGYVRWSHEPNRGFLRALDNLAKAADAIGERDEAERCQLFVLQLEPSGLPAE